MAYADNNQSGANSFNLETFGIVWLDPKINHNEHGRDAQKQLRVVINHLQIFENSDDCQKYIEETPKGQSLLVITSGQLGQKIVPRIHDLHRVLSIYVYCMNKKLNEQWAKQYKKVRHLHF